MKKPRIADFDPDANVPSLKSPLDDMPPIVRVKKELVEAVATNDLRGGSAFFPSYKGEGSPGAQPKESKLGVQPSSTTRTGSTPSTTRSPVRDVRVVPPVPLGPPRKRVMKQRHPFDIYRDQYDALHELALEERKQGGVGSMSAMVRQALDTLITAERSKRK